MKFVMVLLEKANGLFLISQYFGVCVIVSIGLLLFFNRERKIGIMFQTVI